MALPRPSDPHGLTAPSAWPDVDETVLDTCAQNFKTASETVEAQCDAAKVERSTLFEGAGLWSGVGASAAWRSLDQRVNDLDSVKNKLKASAQLFSDSHQAVTRAKNAINDIVTIANRDIQDILDNTDIPEDQKTHRIREIIDTARQDCADIVEHEGFSISGKPPPSDATTMLDNETETSGSGDHQDPTRVQLVSNILDPGNADVGERIGLPGAPHAPLPPDALDAGKPGGGEAAAPPPEAPSPLEPVAEAEPGKGGVGEGAPPPAPQGPIELPPAEGPGPAGPGIPGTPGVPGSPAAPAPPRVGTPSPVSSGVTPPTSPTSPTAPSTPGAVPTTPQQQFSDFQQSMAEAASKAASQAPIQPQPSAPMGGAPISQPIPPPMPDTPPAPPATQAPSAAGPPGGGTAAPVAPPPAAGTPPGPALPLGPPPTPSPAAPIAPAGGVPPSVASAAAAGAGTVGAPAPVPVSAARAQREAIAAAATAGALRRRKSGGDPVMLAQRIGAALNVGIADVGFFWVTALAKDGTIVVANNYGLGYIPEGVNLPENVKMVTADESIPATVRGTWATYPILALHGWAQHHNTDLRVVIATEDQFKGFDPGAPKIVLRPDDIPDNGAMEGRHRLQVIAPDTALTLAAVSGAGLLELLPPPPTDATPPEDQRQQLWFEVFRPLLSNAPDRAAVQLQTFVNYAEHASELALYRAHTGPHAADQRAAIADWIYWQHLSVLMSDAIPHGATV